MYHEKQKLKELLCTHRGRKSGNFGGWFSFYLGFCSCSFLFSFFLISLFFWFCFVLYLCVRRLNSKESLNLRPKKERRQDTIFQNFLLLCNQEKKNGYFFKDERVFLFFFFKDLVSLLPLSTSENKIFGSYLAKVTPFFLFFFFSWIVSTLIRTLFWSSVKKP